MKSRYFGGYKGKGVGGQSSLQHLPPRKVRGRTWQTGWGVGWWL